MSQPLRISCTAFELLFCGSNINEADIELQSAKDVEYIELVIPGCRRSIQQRSKNLFREEFQAEPLAVQGGALSFSVHQKKWYSFCKPVVKLVRIDVNYNSSEQKFQTLQRELDITIGFSPNSPSVDAVHTRVTPSNTNGLRPTTEALLDQCPRFRILVIGQSGVGKSTLINKAFGIEQAVEWLCKYFSENLEPGKADIEKEFISPQNDRFVLHDSKGFEPADNVNIDIVKLFIEDRKKREHVRDQLHAVWLSFPIPIDAHGDRLLKDGAETFLKQDNSVLHNIPTIVVFTKYDKLLTHMAMQREADLDAAAKVYLQKHCFDPIAEFTGSTDLSYVAVSSNRELEEGRKRLIDITHQKVAERFNFQADTPSPVPVVTQMAQRTLPHLKIEGSIDVGRQRYWTTLTSSGNFKDHTITDCLAVIHTDIVCVWNFNDPYQYLYSDEFRGLMVKLAGTVDGSTPESPRLPRVDTTDAICNIIPRESNIPRPSSPLILLAPLILPFEAGLNLVHWVRETYQQLPNVHHKFMAYILDLVHVLEILFTLTANNNEKKLTRGAISVAFNAYYYSEMRHDAHKQIKDFDFRIPGPDPVLQEIISLVRMSPINNDHISGTLQSISPEDLARDDEWHTSADRCSRQTCKQWLAVDILEPSWSMTPLPAVWPVVWQAMVTSAGCKAWGLTAFAEVAVATPTQ
ncbi:hypothetical protein EDC04DRAFT_2601446 [Pisolithus marmoratus]|nr:hypothetical protein EDC04DRAFT_2601446 [Pisolithus marmoratus]